MSQVDVKMPASKADDTAAAVEVPLVLGSESDGTSSVGEDLKKPELHPIEIKKLPMRTLEFQLFNAEHPVSFNPLTSMVGMGSLWGIAIWCMLSPESALETLGNAKTQVSFYFSWFYILSRPFFMFFVMYIGWKYGHIKLGPKDSKPEFSDVAYFSMLFSAGVAVGLFFFGVSEPLWYQSDNWFANQNYRTQDEIDQNAINQTLYHWGLAAWGSYLVVALGQALGTFRFGLPMTFRASFYPLLGEYTWGFWGDIIDGFTLVTTVGK
jgi:choline-glycine betaine transporter